MRIRTKLILNYSTLSLALLLSFSFIVVLSYVKYRQADFTNRLHNRAVSTANLLLNENAIDSSMLSRVDKNIVSTLSELQITIYNQNNRVIYTNSSSPQINQNVVSFPKHKFLQYFSLGHKTISFTHNNYGHVYKIEASAVDVYGNVELKSLLKILSWVFGFSIVLIAGFGFYNALWSLKPFKKVIREVEEINPSLIKKRVSVQGNDELSQLANTFNTLLDRIEQAFEIEKSFISNASHEMRTPVTSVLGQIEVALNKTRTEDEYKNILQSVYDDTLQMAVIINGFLELAQTNLASNQIQMSAVRIDELIFSIVEDFEKSKHQYSVSVEFVFNPESETQLECLANERLLRLMFSNLIDNACKYSDDKKAKVHIGISTLGILITITDYGVGIPEMDLENIYKPLYRGTNVTGKPGHGIGLAIVKRIADLHNITVGINSNVNIGTVVSVQINTIYN